MARRHAVAKAAPRLLAVVALVTTVFAEGVAIAGPDEREQCAGSAEQAQQLRDEGKYRRAREQMLICVREVCPGPIKTDCGKWLSELDRDAPTVVFGARDDKGIDVLDVKVSMDNVPIQGRLDGKPVLVDSGEHTFTFEAKDGTVKEERVLLRAAEKARPIVVRMSSSSRDKDSKDAAYPDGEKHGFDRTLVPALIAGGVGVVALGSFAFFGLSGKGDVDDLQRCKPTCPEERVDSVRTKLAIADVSLGVGIVALGVATYLYVVRPRVDTTKTQTTTARSEHDRGLRFDAHGVTGGGYATVGGTF